MWTSIVTGVVSLLTAIIGSVSSFFSWRKEQAIKEQGRLEQKNADLEDQIEVIVKANETREEAADAARSVPESDSLPDDGFRRD